MDEIVLRAIAKWPNVPSVYNWLSLDRRGQWRVKGELVSNAALVDFVGRNYEQDAQGRWFFQNGPQRVFVTLAYTPFIYRVEPDAAGRLCVRPHSGGPASVPTAAWLDENADVLLQTPGGVGLVADRDLPLIVERLTKPSGEPLDEATLELLAQGLAAEGQILQLHLGPRTIGVHAIRSHDVPARFGFDPSPAPRPGEPEC